MHILHKNAYTEPFQDSFSSIHNMLSFSQLNLAEIRNMSVNALFGILLIFLPSKVLFFDRGSSLS